MKRLGLFTGKIYTEDDFKEDKIHECCVCISDSGAADTEYVVDKHLSYRDRCTNCYGCPESRTTFI